MSSTTGVGSGIVRTASGRMTYAPDGHVVEDENCSTFEPIRSPVKFADPASSPSSEEESEEKSITTPGSRPFSRRQSFVSGHDNDDDDYTDVLTRLASRDQALGRTDTLALQDDDSTLDPSSKDFDLHRWTRRFMAGFDEEGIKALRAGFVFKNLNVSGSGAALQLQQTVASILWQPAKDLIGAFGHTRHKQILKDFNGILQSGELLIVLGRPGSGCSTFLKTICGEQSGLKVDSHSEIHYNGIPQERMVKEFKGEIVYNQEVDKHFPHLTVGQTLEHAASARTPSHRVKGLSRKKYAEHVAQVVMAVFGLSHTYNTKVGSDFVRGVSGGERKRVSIAEMALTAAPIAAWDNSTRGLDSATALKFVQSLRTLSDLNGSTHAVAIYQASQAIYDIFDKAIVLYEGREIYYGKASNAREYFEKQGWYCPPRQTTGDFLTSVTNPAERKAREGMANKTPRTPDDFAKYWQESEEYKIMMREVEVHERDTEKGGDTAAEWQAHKRTVQSNHTRPKSPYLISVPMQIKLNTKRAYQRVWNDKSATIATIGSQIILALIIGSVFYGTEDATVGFMSKGAVLFFAVLLNALIAISEINALYAQRPIVEKHASYALYHPATEAIAGVVSDIPVKFAVAVAFNIILYFMANLARDAGKFFLYFLVTFVIMFVMSAVFRTMAAITKTVSQAMTLAGILVLALVVYTGYVLPTKDMHPWFSWIHYINPVYYAYEILIANEFHGTDFTCSSIIPSYTPLVGDSWICAETGAVAGQDYVNGDAYIEAAYSYSYSHVWRNFGILIGFLIFFMILYFVASELNSSTTSSAEVLVFRRGHVPDALKEDEKGGDEEKSTAPADSHGKDQDEATNVIPAQKDIFTWRDVVYDIEIKGEPRRLLDHVSGWVKPGTLTALMGVSGAGKTTLLDVLAQRTTMGVITGDMLVNGKPFDASFQRKTGYVQQQDLHLDTATVRESLRFSALLRQPKSVPKAEKYKYVEDVIDMLNMRDFAEAVVGVPGQGLNVEQRKLLTIGVELAAKPKLLLFLDEPTSGLDSQSSWAICAFLRKLADAGQAVLCTIHQPSAILFQEFDRLLFLAKGGKTVYFGPIGENSETLLEYFESNGARECGKEENPAEFMLEIVNNGSSGKGHDWHEVWKGSKEAEAVQTELDKIHRDTSHKEVDEEEEAGAHDEFAMPFWTQLQATTNRCFQQYWRMPTYIYAKWMLGAVAGLFIGFSFFNSGSSLQGIQNVIFSLFMLATIFSSLVQQIMPLFVTQRSLYEVRERPSKAYSWKAFLMANIIVEIPYQIILGLLVFACYYYPIVGIQASVRQGLVLLYSIQFFIMCSTFAHMCIAALPDAQTAGAVTTLLFAMSLIFCGVMQGPTALPGFWIFMYRVSPFTYWVAGMATTELHGEAIVCSASELSSFNPPAGQTCGEYLADYLATAVGTLLNPDATADCQYCQIGTSDELLAEFDIYWDDRWRNFGIVWAYVLFNIAVTVFLYYTFRVANVKAFSFKKKSGAKAADASKKLASKGRQPDKETEFGGIDDTQHQKVI